MTHIHPLLSVHDLAALGLRAESLNPNAEPAHTAWVLIASALQGRIMRDVSEALRVIVTANDYRDEAADDDFALAFAEARSFLSDAITETLKLLGEHDATSDGPPELKRAAILTSADTAKRAQDAARKPFEERIWRSVEAHNVGQQVGETIF